LSGVDAPPGGQLRARAWTDETGVSVEVEADTGRTSEDRSDPGLSVVASITDEFGMRPKRGAMRLRAHKPWSFPASDRSGFSDRFRHRCGG
jgi:hypothetical protein